MATDYRSPDRGTAITFRMSASQRNQLRADGAQRGFKSVQQYLESLVFGEAGPARKPGLQPKDQSQEELPMTG